MTSPTEIYSLAVQGFYLAVTTLDNLPSFGEMLVMAGIWIWDNPLQSAGASTGILGAALMAGKSRYATWAWPIWIFSNVAWIWYGSTLPLPAYGMILQNMAFGAINFFGAWTWARAARSEAALATLTSARVDTSPQHQISGTTINLPESEIKWAEYYEPN